jgi:hypothetical protein
VKAGAKIRLFILNYQMFSEVFFKKFRAISMSLQDSCLASLTSPYAIHLNSLIMLLCRSLLNAGAKVVLYNIHSKPFANYFYKDFNTFLLNP